MFLRHGLSIGFVSLNRLRLLSSRLFRHTSSIFYGQGRCGMQTIYSLPLVLFRYCLSQIKTIFVGYGLEFALINTTAGCAQLSAYSQAQLI